MRIPLDGGFACYRTGGDVPGPPFPLVGARALWTVDAFLGVDYGEQLFVLQLPDVVSVQLVRKPR